MKLWLLKRKDNDGYAVYDASFGFVVRAETEISARGLAAVRSSGDEPHEIWKDKKITTCKDLKQKGERKIILEDFNAWSE